MELDGVRIMATAQELLEEKERLAELKGSIGNRLPIGLYFDISRALAGLDAAGENEVNSLRTVMGSPANFSMPSGGLTAASVKSMMGMQNEDILRQIIHLQSQSDIKDEAGYKKWYNDQGFDPYFYESAREKWRTSQKALRSEAEELHKSTVTRPSDIVAAEKAALALKTAKALDVYTGVEEKATVLLNRIKGQYTSGAKPGVPAISSDKAMDALTSGLIELGIKGEDLASYTTRLKTQIDLTEEMRAGRVNKTAGRYATQIIKGLEDETYDYVQAMAKFNELTAGLDPSSAGVTAARTALTKHIDAMKYTEETLAVVLRTGPNAGMMDFVTKKQLLEDLAREPDKRLYVAPQGKSDLPPGMSIVAWMVVDDKGKQIIPDHFIQKMALEGYSRLWALDEKERAWWNAWVEKYKETNPNIMEQLVKFALGAQGAGGSSTGVGAVTVTEQ